METPVTIVVYNTLGEKVATLVDGIQAPGTRTVEFDGGGLPGGVYFYRLTAGSGVSQTRKMVLMK